MNLVPLHAGPLRLVFQPDDGSIRWLYAGDHEVLRGIAALVRDQGWATVPGQMSELSLEQKPDGFRVSFLMRCCDGIADFRWRGEIAGRANGSLEFDFDGEALVSFQRNRIGFSVLHPAECAGAACTLEKDDGSIVAGRFPGPVSPHQPFLNLRAITHDVTPTLRAEVRFEGDTFETEDQRNWTDASFKTYCTPLALPRPVRVEPGTRIRQRVTLRLVRAFPSDSAAVCLPWEDPKEVTVTLGEPLAYKLPRLGTAIGDSPLVETNLRHTRSLRLAHLRCDLRFADPAYPVALANAVAQANELGVGLELAVALENDDDDEPCSAVRNALEQFTPLPRIDRWLVMRTGHDCTPASAITTLRRALAGSLFDSPCVGGGALDSFTELNRSWDADNDADFAFFGCNPQVHASDTASMVDTLPMQALACADARTLTHRPIVVSPVTLHRRWQACDTHSPPNRAGGSMPFRVDPRLSQGFAAAWTVGSLAALATSGAVSATYFELKGENGLFSSDGTARPVLDVFAALAPFVGAQVVKTSVSRPDRVAALALIKSGQRLLLLGNLNDSAVTVGATENGMTRPYRLAAHQVMAISGHG